MRCSLQLLSRLLLIAAALSASAACGQSLSIVKKGETNFWIEASAPSNDPCVLQASANLHLWADIHEVQEHYSYPLDRVGLSPRPVGDGQRYFRLVTSPPPAPPIRIVLIGDSMTADCCGWGQSIYGYVKPNATVINYAAAYTSTKVFLGSAELDKLLLLKPDYVLIQYGFVDGAWGPDLAPDRYTSLDEFGANLRTIVEKVRGFQGVPILVTLHAPRRWDANGKVVHAWEDRNGVTRAVAAELQTPLIDLYQLTEDLFNAMGPNGCDFMHWGGAGPEDVMHLSPLGAQFVSQLVVNALPDNLGPYLTGLFDPPAIP